MQVQEYDYYCACSIKPPQQNTRTNGILQQSIPFPQHINGAFIICFISCFSPT